MLMILVLTVCILNNKLRMGNNKNISKIQMLLF